MKAVFLNNVKHVLLHVVLQYTVVFFVLFFFSIYKSDSCIRLFVLIIRGYIVQRLAIHRLVIRGWRPMLRIVAIVFLFFNFHYTSTTLHYPSYLSNGLSIFEFYQRHSIAGGSHYLCHLRVCSLLSIHPASSMATRLPGEEGIFTTKNGCWVTLDIKHGFSEL